MNENVLKASDGYGRATGEFMDDRSYRGLFGDLPELKTERLTLRKMEMSDANDMYSYASLDEVTRYLLWTPHLNIDETKGYIEYVRREYRKGSVADWAISLDSESRMIGTVGFSAVDRENNSVELGYMRARRSGGLLKQRFASLALIVCSFGSWTGMSDPKMSRLHAASEKKDLSVTCCLSMVHTEQSIFIRLFRMNTSHCENEYGTNTPLRASEPAAAYFSDP